MEIRDQEYVLKMARDHGVKFVRLWFTDILGFLKSFAITVNQLEDALAEGVGFDGASIEGFARLEESDMVAMPDPGTFALLPWRHQGGETVARLFCDIRLPGGEPYEGDPRWVLRRALDRARKLGYTFYVGPELEFFYFRSPRPPLEALDEGGYFDLTPQDAGNDLRRDTILTLEAMGIEVELSHHEAAHSQHEIDLRYTDALTMADSTVTYRLVVKEVAQQYGVYATFMPKPLHGAHGSGMHVHQSLFHGERNAFHDPRDPLRISETCRAYIAGLLRYAPEITLVTNQWVNSYKRLVPGYEAPTYLSWAMKNRSDLLRVPGFKPGREEAVRVEFRSPDPACNPYLAFAAMLWAGLEGIERGMTPPEPVDRDVNTLTPQERAAAGIGSLPSDLYDAIQLAESSDLLRQALGEHVFHKLIENKRLEWERYRAQVTSYELEEYLPLL